MSTINLNETRINVPNVPFTVIEKDVRKEERKPFYEEFYKNKEGNWNRKYLKFYFVGIPTMSRAMKILKANINEEIFILDGYHGRHLHVSMGLFNKEGAYIGSAFLNSHGQIDVYLTKTKQMLRYSTTNYKEFLTICREIRDCLLK